MAKMAGIAGLVITLVLAAVIAGALVPTAIQNIHGANQTGWTTSEKAVWSVLALVVIIAVAYAFFKYVT